MDELAPNGVQERDVRALIAMLVHLESKLMTFEMPSHDFEWLRRRLAGVGLVDESASEQEVRQALNDMNYRLRYARGETQDPPTPVPVPVLADDMPVRHRSARGGPPYIPPMTHIQIPISLTRKDAERLIAMIQAMVDDGNHESAGQGDDASSKD